MMDYASKDVLRCPRSIAACARISRVCDWFIAVACGAALGAVLALSL